MKSCVTRARCGGGGGTERRTAASAATLCRIRIHRADRRTLRRLFGPATNYSCVQLQVVLFDLERLSQKVGSCQLRRSRLLQCTSPNIDCSVKVSVHEFHTFLGIGWYHRRK